MKITRFALSLAVFALSTISAYYIIGTTWYGEGDTPSSRIPMIISLSESGSGDTVFRFRGELESMEEFLPDSAFDVPVGHYHFELEGNGTVRPVADFEVSASGSGKMVEGHYTGDDYSFSGMYLVTDSGIEFKYFRLGHGFVVLQAIMIAIVITWVAGKVMKRWWPAGSAAR